MTKRKKIVWSLIAIAVLILLVVCAYMVSVPKLNIVYEVNEHTYYQSSRSILRHEIQVNGYDQVSNVLLNDKALYATAQKGGHRYFLFHDEATDTTISVPDEDHAFSRIYASFMYNGRYTVEYEYADGEEFLYPLISRTRNESRLNCRSRCLPEGSCLMDGVFLGRIRIIFICSMKINQLNA